MAGVSNSSLLVDFDLARGITLRRIVDVVTGLYAFLGFVQR
jgi:hypothetical protein